MYSGIIEIVRPIISILKTPEYLKYGIHLEPKELHDLKIGASIAINGVCQTVVDINKDGVFFEAIDETLRVTNLQNIKNGDLVHVERSLKFGDEIGGHLLSGHVYGTATITNITIPAANNYTIEFKCPSSWMKYILPKGFIALDGVSLTVNEPIINGGFKVYLIPETLKRTTFGNKKIGDAINVELDHQTQAIVNTVQNYLKNQAVFV